MSEDTALERINRIKSAMKQKDTFLNNSVKNDRCFQGTKQVKNVTPYTSRSGDPNRSK
jgi:hypothetical protein